MVDQYSRNIDYLRISVTDRCNLRCVYCMPEEGVESIPHSEILTYEEILRVVKAAVANGIVKIKITGGEPLVRRDIGELIRQIKRVCGIQTVTMTTNGVLFGEFGAELAAAGLDDVNFSLDCLDADTFHKLTRVDAFSKVLKAVELSLLLGLRTKINCVPIGEYNSANLNTMAGLAKRYPLDVRFIELMPIGLGKQFSPVDSRQILKLLAQEFGEPKLSLAIHGNGPASYYDFPGFKGSIGFISALSHEFCEKCNRARLTAGGELKPCLCYNKSVELKPLLRSGISDDLLKKTIQKTIFDKPLHHNLCGDLDETSEMKKMVQIGG